jgi:hypothetical protein
MKFLASVLEFSPHGRHTSRRRFALTASFRYAHAGTRRVREFEPADCCLTIRYFNASPRYQPAYFVSTALRRDDIATEAIITPSLISDAAALRMILILTINIFEHRRTFLTSYI